nr:HAD family hydrolase [uncultured Niameybacter sp.]
MAKAIFFDIDGTLINCFKGLMDLTPKVKDAIRDLQARGHYVFIATGRPYAFLSEAILNFGFDGFILTNGAQVIINNENLYTEAMDKKFVKDAVEEFEKLNIQYILEDAYYSYMKEEYEEFYAFYEGLGISRKLIKGKYNLEEINVQKIEVRCPNKEAEEKCLNFIQQHPEYDYWHSIHHMSFEIYPRSNTKATGILKALKHLNISIEESYAFGDGKNDIEMLETVGCGIAMGNALDEVKQYAKEVTDTVDEDGVATGIEKYILCK